MTEQDVVNEEMYEEEDEDLPAQIRRLQQFAHLQTNSDHFNYRLQNYMASHIGTRQALMEQSYANVPFFANRFASPQQTTMLPSQMFHYNQGFRLGMNPTSSQHFPSNMHHRSSSMSSHQDANFTPSNPTSPMSPHGFDQRRMSMPTGQMQSPAIPQAQATNPPSASQPGSHVDQQTDGSTTPTVSQSQEMSAPVNPASMAFPSAAAAMLDGSHNANLAPFSMSLPSETQQLLASPTAMGESNAFNPYLFAGSPMPLSYSYKPNSSNPMTSCQSSSVEPSLSMPRLDTNFNSPDNSGYATSANTDFGYFGGYDGLFGDNLKFSNMTRAGSVGGSDVATPEGTDWQNFIDTSFDDGVGGNPTSATPLSSQG